MKKLFLLFFTFCCLPLFNGCVWRNYSSSSSNSDPSSQSTSLQDYRIVLIPSSWNDESSAEYIVKRNILLKDNGSNTEICGPLERIDNNVYEVSVGTDTRNGGKIWPYNAAIFKRNNEEIGRVTDNNYRFAVFDFNEMRVYNSESDYGYRDISDMEYLRFYLVPR